jgi:DNA mismatch repair protein MutL
VKFSNEGDLFRAVLHALNEALSSNIKIPTFSDTNNNKDTDQMAMSDIVIEAKESIPNPVPIKEWDTDTVNNLKISASLPINEEMQLYTVEKSEQNDSSLAEVLVEGEIIGQVFDTYIIIQYDEQLFFIDQHAAHERIRYAYLSEKNRTDSVPAQTLLNPSVIELLPREKSLLIDNSDFIAKMGFDFDDFGNNAVLVRQVPAIDHIDDIKELLMGIVDSIEQLESFNDAASDEFLYSVACKAAIKANQKLTIQEMKALLNEFAGLKKAFTCPHGRPVILSIEKKKIEKEFKRVL